MGIIKAVGQAISGNLADQWSRQLKQMTWGENCIYQWRFDPQGTECQRWQQYRVKWFGNPCV